MKWRKGGLAGSMRLLCRQMEELREIAISNGSSATLDMPSEIINRMTQLLFENGTFSISEQEIKYLCHNNDVFWRGIEYFMQGRVLQRQIRLAKSGLEVHARVTGKSAPYYDVDIVFEAGGKHLRTRCNCPDRMHNMCKHVVAVLVCWSRKPRSFNLDIGELVHPDGDGLVDPVFAERFENALARLEDVVERMPSSSRKEDFAVLQQLGTIMRWGSVGSKSEKRETVEFAKLTSVVSASIIAALDAKYGLGAMALYNSATAGIMGELMERFIEKVQKPTTTGQSTIKEEAQIQGDGEAHITPIAIRDTEKKNRSRDVSRSWDGILEEFLTSGG